MKDDLTLVKIQIDGLSYEVPSNYTVASALVISGNPICRTSVTGQKRAPFCGMGICQECRILINGQYRQACQILCQDDMIIKRL